MSTASNAQQKSPAARLLVSFVALVFLLSVPFVIAGFVSDAQLLPHLPISALAAFMPALAAGILEYRRGGYAAVSNLFARAGDFRRLPSPLWYVPTLLLFPALLAISYIAMWRLGPRFILETPAVLAAPVMLIAFFIAGLGEELGWTGYAIERLESTWSALRTALVIGVIWAAWHVVPLLQANRSWPWIAGWCVGTVATRVLLVWLFNNAGRSVAATALFHASSNVSYFLFPSYAAHYDPWIMALTLTLAAAIVSVSGLHKSLRG